jgi:hypothetical protein
MTRRKTEFRQNDLFRGDPERFQLNACVGDNGGRYDLFHYAHGYFAATRKLFEAAPRHEVGLAVDSLVYPTCYNFRHSIELFLKYLVRSYSALLNDPSVKFEMKHGLMGNWKTAEAAADRFG